MEDEEESFDNLHNFDPLQDFYWKPWTILFVKKKQPVFASLALGSENPGDSSPPA